LVAISDAFRNGNEKVDDDRDPDLGLHGVGRGAVEGLDPKMPLDPFEEQFHLLPLLVDIGDGLRRDGEQVGQKHEAPMILPVVERDAAQRLGVGQPRPCTHKRNNLIDANPATLVHRGRRQASEAQVSFGADHEESRKTMDSVEAFEVEVSTIQCAHRLLFQRRRVQEVDVVHRPGSQAHKGRDRSPQIQKRAHFHGGLRLSEHCPGEKGKAQIDRAGVQRVEGTIQFDGQFLGLVRLPGDSDDRIAHLLVDPEVASLVGVGQSGSGDLSSHPDVVELFAMGGETRFDIAQRFPSAELGKRHGDELIPAGKRSDAVVALVPRDRPPEFVPRQMGQQLCKDGFSRIHGRSSPDSSRGNYSPTAERKN
jgi:hypothetical protein